MSEGWVIKSVSVRDVRFRNGPGEGTDAVHSTGIYGYAVCILHAGRGDETLKGSGLAFTLGGGTDTVCSAILELGKGLVGRQFEGDIMANFGSTFRVMANHPTWRWLGPQKGNVHLAVAALTNACFDLWAKIRNKPLWRLLLDLEPEEIVRLLDFYDVEDVLTPSEALDMLQRAKETRSARQHVLEDGYPGYDTSFGWIQFTDDELRQNAGEALAQGFRAIKLKVGSPDTTRDIRRACMIRDLVGPDVTMMLDVNQQWNVSKSLRMWDQLQHIKPLWLEEPIHPDDVVGHQTLQSSGIPVAIGEAVPNAVLFKSFLQMGACTFVQVDPTRTGGVAECILVALMAKKFNLTVVPHVGDMGQISQHLVLFYHVALGLPKLFLEYIPHLRDCFVDPANVEQGVYVAPQLPGASQDIKESIGDFDTHGIFDTIQHAHVKDDGEST